MVKVAAVCERMSLPYFVTGSIASMTWGEPRFTRDVDMVVELPSWKVRDFCDEFPAPEYYVDEQTAMQAAQGPSMFSILHVTEGVKADIIVFSGKPFDESRLGRARKVRVEGGSEVMLAAPEDVILKKLEYFREGGSDKHLRDIASMIKVSGPELDYAYIEQWALRIGVKEQWSLIKQRLNLP